MPLTESALGRQLNNYGFKKFKGGQDAASGMHVYCHPDVVVVTDIRMVKMKKHASAGKGCGVGGGAESDVPLQKKRRKKAFPHGDGTDTLALVLGGSTAGAAFGKSMHESRQSEAVLKHVLPPPPVYRRELLPQHQKVFSSGSTLAPAPPTPIPTPAPGFVPAGLLCSSYVGDPYFPPVSQVPMDNDFRRVKQSIAEPLASGSTGSSNRDPIIVGIDEATLYGFMSSMTFRMDTITRKQSQMQTKINAVEFKVKTMNDADDAVIEGSEDHSKRVLPERKRKM